MHETGIVRGGKRLQHRIEDCERLGLGQGAPRSHDVAHGAAADVLHDEVHDAGVRIAALIMDGDHVRIRELCRGVRLALEPVDEFGVLGERGMHHLHCDIASEAKIVGDVHRGHAAAGNKGFDAVATVERATYEGLAGIGHGCESRSRLADSRGRPSRVAASRAAFRR